MAQNYVLLDRIELNASAASVTFSNIPQTGYTDLKIVISARTNRALEVDGIKVYLNNDSNAANYSGKRLYGTGSSAGSDSVWYAMPFMSAANATANTFSNTELYFPNYLSSAAKSISVDGVGENNATTTYMGLGAVLWSGTSAINSITINPEVGTAILAGSTFSLYGVAAYGTTPTVAPKADGGNVIATDGTYWYHAFLSNGTFTPQTNLTADVLVVAGGGGGGAAYIGGGGGAGGLRALASQAFAATSYACTIGSGGAGGAGSASPTIAGLAGTNGSSSSIASISVTGGGGGGSSLTGSTGEAAKSGGSGGGGTYFSTSGGTGNAGGYSPVEGYAGGIGDATAPNGAGGGGGGAGGAGSNAVANSAGGNGGVGASTYNSINFSSWLTATNTGSGGKLAAGGGGSGYATLTPGSGGVGGGGNGANNSTVNATSGTVNTGSGGGGTERNGTYTGGNGGSGIIIIRYAA